MNHSTIVSIYQAGESLYKTFDKVCVIYEGRMAYFGPADLARKYFTDMGYTPAHRQTTADFLVSVTDSLGRTMLSGEDSEDDAENSRRPIPQTPAEFEEYYKKSDICRMNREDIAAYKKNFVEQRERADVFKAGAKAEHARHTRRKVAHHICLYSLLMMSPESVYDFYSDASAHCDDSPSSDYERQFHRSRPQYNVSRL